MTSSKFLSVYDVKIQLLLKNYVKSNSIPCSSGCTYGFFDSFWGETTIGFFFGIFAVGTTGTFGVTKSSVDMRDFFFFGFSIISSVAELSFEAFRGFFRLFFNSSAAFFVFTEVQTDTVSIDSPDLIYQ